MQEKDKSYKGLNIPQEEKKSMNDAAIVAPASEFDDLHMMLINNN